MIVLEVRTFNERVINCYKKIGFSIVDHYMKDTLLGYREFVKIKYIYRKI